MPSNSKKRSANELDDEDASVASETLVERITKLEAQANTMAELLRTLKDSVDDLQKSQKDERASDTDLSDDEESVVDPNDRWETMFRQLRDYRIVNGDCNVKSSGGNSKLSNWVNDQKKLYSKQKAGKKNALKPERVYKLESLGFCWGKKYPAPATWDQMFEQLCNFKQKMGNCKIPFNESNPSPLARWCANQRREYKRFKHGRDTLLTMDEIGKLKDIGMSWKGPKL